LPAELGFKTEAIQSLWKSWMRFAASFFDEGALIFEEK
jgi:hypothetical protein